MKKRYKLICAAVLLIMLLSVGCKRQNDVLQPEIVLPDTGDISVQTFADRSGMFYRANKNGKADKYYICGMNIGFTEPLSDSSCAQMSYDTYMEWFSQISAMNVNTVRVFSVMNPDFYNALYDFNAQSDSPLCLMQGIWFSDTLAESVAEGTESSEKIFTALERAARETVDIIHGNSDYTQYGDSPALYDRDVSDITIGYIIGLEYSAQLVKTVNVRSRYSSYDGDFIMTTPDASPFEALLCRSGDSLISYETTNYKAQIPVAFLNWQTLDTLTHSNEPFAEEEDSQSLNTEHITAKRTYFPGLFAAVNVYPYYPEFMNFQKEYKDYTDENGEHDNYRAYLNELKSQYTVPLLIAEYGLSTSRGTAHEGENGYNQGGLSEQEQGELCAKMTADIQKAGCCGGLLFCWQDEWFKSTWNIENYTPENPDMRTHNLASAEQGYGILAYDVTETYPDGNLSEWADTEKIPCTNVSVKYDADYMCINLQLPYGFNADENYFYIPIQINGYGSNYCSEYGVSFSEQPEFLLVLHGKYDTRLLCDAAYDVFMFRHGVIRGVFGNDLQEFPPVNSGVYNKIYLYTANERYLPDDYLTLAPEYVEFGLLAHGDCNPSHEDYNSLADFYIGDGFAEIRLPWYMLGVMNAREGICIAQPDGDEMRFTSFDNIKIGSGDGGYIKMYDAHFEKISDISYRSRLKKSYDILKECFAEILNK